MSSVFHWLGKSSTKGTFQVFSINNAVLKLKKMKVNIKLCIEGNLAFADTVTARGNMVYPC